MQFYEMLNELSKLLGSTIPEQEILNKPPPPLIIRDHTPITNEVKIRLNFPQLIKFFGEIYSSNKWLYDNFTQGCIYSYILENIQKNHQYSKQEAEEFFNKLPELPQHKQAQIITPITGIKFNNNDIEKLTLGCFTIARNTPNNHSPYSSNENISFYIEIEINNIYEDDKAVEKSQVYFTDFIRIILFIENVLVKNFSIKLGYQKEEFQYYKIITQSSYGALGYQKSKEIEINNTLSENHPQNLHLLWNLYHKQYNHENLTDIEQRIINSALAIGESYRSDELKNSIIYTCIALEALFSFDEGQLYQRSINDKISDCLAFIIGRNQKHRKEIISFTKKIYSARSALVHGSNPSKYIDFFTMNSFIREAIIELLNNEKYKNLKTIDQLYNMVKDAQLSY